MSKPKVNPGNAPVALFPTLRPLVEGDNLDVLTLSIAVESDGARRVRTTDKHVISVTDGEKVVSWTVASLTELFRGDKLPPPDMEHYPPEYVEHLFFIERHLMSLNDLIGDRTDQEMEEIYSALRRRPDGRSLGTTHDFMWQVGALLLGRHALSAVEFEAIVGALLHSARAWGKRPVSRFYAAYLRDTFAKG
jgi:hypothetical protein